MRVISANRISLTLALLAMTGLSALWAEPVSDARRIEGKETGAMSKRPIKNFAAKGADAIEMPTPDMLKEAYTFEYQRLAERIKKGNKPFKPEQALSKAALANKADRTPVDTGIRQLEALLAKLKTGPKRVNIRSFAKPLASIKARAAKVNKDNALPLYIELRKLTRKAVFANPLLNFKDILFVSRGVRDDHRKRKSEYNGDHFCDQYFGHNGQPGGGLFILKNWKSDKPKLVDITKGLKVPSGMNKGQLLNDGTFLSPDLSWDGKTVLFAWSCGNWNKWKPENRFNIFKVNIDGTGLTRLTNDDQDDIDPIWMPNGRVVFLSTRRTGFGRCHGRPVPAYTMYSMKADGSDMITIDYHETNEFHPSVDNQGMIVYTRWDYVDRDHNGAHHMWHCQPDGRDPRSYHSNYAYPLTTVEPQKHGGSIRDRPWAEFNCRAIPGNDDKFVATAGPHHGQAYGSLVLIDISIPDDNKMSQTKRITPDVRFPESEGWARPWHVMAYGTAWPLSETFYLANYKDTACVVDAFGNNEPILRTLNGMRPLDPMPCQARKKAPIKPTQTYQGERASKNAPAATISVMNVHITDEFGKLPKGAKPTEMRIIQLLPKSTPRVNNPQIGWGDQSLARISLGVVPIEKDGSVYCKAPVGKAIYFQILDKNGMAIQSMRSATYAHLGEQLSCVGCHEDKQKTPNISKRPLAMKRAPSELKPEVKDFKMFNFYKNVKPILEKKCLPCHQAKKKGLQKMNYQDLKGYAFWFGHGIGRKMSGGSRTLPGKFGAKQSKLGKTLLGIGHQKALKAGKFTKDDLRNIYLWLDLNSNQYSAYKKTEEQKKGELVWPMYDVNPKNYDGTEKK